MRFATYLVWVECLAGWGLSLVEGVGMLVKARQVFTTGQGDKIANMSHSRGNSLYAVDLEVGGQSFRVAIDTGSTNLWLASTKCAGTPGCKGLKLYEPEMSTTSHLDGSEKPMSVTFGSGEYSAIPYYETVSFGGHGGLSVSKQRIFAADYLSAGLLDGDLSGLLGLGFRALAFHGHMPLFDHLCKEKLVTNNQFYFLFTREHEYFVVGEPSDFTDHYHGELTTVPVLDYYYWSVELDDLLYNGKSILTDAVRAKDCNSTTSKGRNRCKLVVDTGMTFSTFPTAAHAALERLQSADCSPDSGSTLTYVIGGKNFEISTSMITGTLLNCSSDVPLLNVGNEHGPLFSVGQPFLRKFLTLHRRGPGGDDAGSQMVFANANTDYTYSLSRSVKNHLELISV